ncbi:C-C motif chemokine 20a.3 [Hypomesus transpacificus]|uniref:C-C motif chemokine 20a.3 n=1 Tax=Hypomesus transpacificus TaxID=137520 RepID=UPI001F07B87E|nr:C-C motif chemokine 20a.3 [Hypomesus transpacificus]
MSVLQASLMTGFVLLTVCLLTGHTAAAAPQGCCTKYTPGRIPFAAIKGYSIQKKEENCPIDSIIFHTKRGKKACTNPAERWVIDYVGRLGSAAKNFYNRKNSKP